VIDANPSLSFSEAAEATPSDTLKQSVDHGTKPNPPSVNDKPPSVSAVGTTPRAIFQTDVAATVATVSDPTDIGIGPPTGTNPASPTGGIPLVSGAPNVLFDSIDAGVGFGTATIDASSKVVDSNRDGPAANFAGKTVGPGTSKTVNSGGKPVPSLGSEINDPSVSANYLTCPTIEALDNPAANPVGKAGMPGAGLELESTTMTDSAADVAPPSVTDATPSVSSSVVAGAVETESITHGNSTFGMPRAAPPQLSTDGTTGTPSVSDLNSSAGLATDALAAEALDATDGAFATVADAIEAGLDSVTPSGFDSKAPPTNDADPVDRAGSANSVG